MKTVLIIILSAITFTSCARRVVTQTPKTQVVVVKKAPRNYRTVVVNGRRYYRWNGQHYRKTRNGYVLVKA